MKNILKISLAAFIILLLLFNLNFSLEKNATSNNATLNIVKSTALAQSEYSQTYCAHLHNCIPMAGSTCIWCGTFWCYTMQPALPTGAAGRCDIHP